MTEAGAPARLQTRYSENCFGDEMAEFDTLPRSIRDLLNAGPVSPTPSQMRDIALGVSQLGASAMEARIRSVFSQWLQESSHGT